MRRTAHAHRAMFTMSLPRWQRWPVYGIGLVCASSGLAWFALQLSGATADPFSAWRPLQHLLSVVHGISSLLAMVLLGSLIPVHVRLGWHFRRHILSGLMLLIALSVLVLTSLVLYYASDGPSRTATRWVHEILGVMSLGFFAAHWWTRGRD